MNNNILFIQVLSYMQKSLDFPGLNHTRPSKKTRASGLGVDQKGRGPPRQTHFIFL